MHMNCGSNIMLVTSPSLLHNSIQTGSKVGNTGRGAAKNTRIGYLHMILETHNK